MRARGTALTPTAAALQPAAIAALGVGSKIATATPAGPAPDKPGTATYDPNVANALLAARPLLVANRRCSPAHLTSAL